MNGIKYSCYCCLNTNMKKLLFILLLCLSITSCGVITINGTFQGLYSYYKTTNNSNPELFEFYTDNIKSYKQNKTNKVLIINDIHLAKEIKSTPKVLVYKWSPKCKSQFCPSLNLLQQNCEAKGIELYIVAEYYDVAMMQKNYIIKRQLLAIDTKYYKSNLTGIYTKRFYNQLTNNNYNNQSSNRFFYFENGTFIKQIASINEL